MLSIYLYYIISGIIAILGIALTIKEGQRVTGGRKLYYDIGNQLHEVNLQIDEIKQRMHGKTKAEKKEIRNSEEYKILMAQYKILQYTYNAIYIYGVMK